MSLGQLHSILQTVTGWENRHLYCFRIGDEAYGPADEDADEDEIDDTTATVAEAFADEQRGLYEYDFGDGWEHDIVVEPTPSPAALGAAVCLDGERACPPEDCGGTGGYAALIEAISHPDTEERRELVAWAEGFDPEAFDIAAVNAALQQLG